MPNRFHTPEYIARLKALSAVSPCHPLPQRSIQYPPNLPRPRSIQYPPNRYNDLDLQPCPRLAPFWPVPLLPSNQSSPVSRGDHSPDIPPFPPFPAWQEHGGEAGDCATFSKGGYDIALLSTGGVLEAVSAVLKGEVDNAYALVRPPG